MSKDTEYRWGIRTKLSVMVGLLVLLSLGSFGLLSYLVTRSTMDYQMGNGLVYQAEMAAARLRSVADSLDEMTVPGEFVYKILQEELAIAKNGKSKTANLDNVILIGAGNKVLADANRELPVGKEHVILKQDRVELEEVWNGKSKASVLYPGRDGRPYKSAYAPVITSDGKVAAVVRVEASAGFLRTVNRVGIILLTTILIITAIAALMGVLTATSIVNPIKKLVQASERLASGDLDTEVNVNSKDEIGFFARTFNQMARNLKQLYEEVAAHGRQIAELAASVAHEVRSPIHAIQGFTELLEDEFDDEDPRLEYTSDIKEEVRILNSKVTDFIHFARPLEIELVPLDIVEILEMALGSVDKETVDNDVSVEINFDLDSLIVRGDYEHLRSAFVNLIRNGVQAMDKGGTLTISLNTINGSFRNSDSKFLEVRISDTGCGMSSDTLERAFDPFYTTNKIDGTGLGLAIVKKVIEAHNGVIKIESTLGSGTTVRVFLPTKEV